MGKVFRYGRINFNQRKTKTGDQGGTHRGAGTIHICGDSMHSRKGNSSSRTIEESGNLPGGALANRLKPILRGGFASAGGGIFEGYRERHPSWGIL